MKMKSFLLAATLLCTLPGKIFAQNFPPDYRYEFGINGGIAPFTIPNGVDDRYKGDNAGVPPAASINFNYNISQNLQVGAELGMTTWKTTSNWNLTDAYGVQLKPRTVTFSIAKPAITSIVQFNFVKPYYSSYKEYNKANVYAGVAAGLTYTVNDGGLETATYNVAPNPSLVYTKQYNYGYGIGYVVGAQIGVSYYVVEHIGFNVEVQGRYTDVGTSDTRYGHVNSRYNLFYFPIKAGIRFRF